MIRTPILWMYCSVLASTPHHSDAGCWQIEWAFKRLKLLLQMEHLKKTDPQGAKAWLQGKPISFGAMFAMRLC